MITQQHAVRVVQIVPLPLSGRTMESEWTSPNATADIFDPGVLTVTSTLDGSIIQTFQPRSWKAVTVYDADGYPDFSFQNDGRHS